MQRNLETEMVYDDTINSQSSVQGGSMSVQVMPVRAFALKGYGRPRSVVPKEPSLPDTNRSDASEIITAAIDPLEFEQDMSTNTQQSFESTAPSSSSRPWVRQIALKRYGRQRFAIPKVQPVQITDADLPQMGCANCGGQYPCISGCKDGLG